MAFLFFHSAGYNVAVAPFTGAWIETDDAAQRSIRKDVAPFTGAWIETKPRNHGRDFVLVAPFTGAWIETRNDANIAASLAGRSLHGSVD